MPVLQALERDINNHFEPALAYKDHLIFITT